MNKSRNYSRRPTVCLPKRKRIGRRKSATRFLFKLAVLFALIAVVGCGGYWGGKQIYTWLSQARLSDWHVKTVAVSGVTGPLQRNLSNLALPYQNQPFSHKDATTLQKRISEKYPMLSDVSVRRGLFNGKLTVSARHRTPLAKFIKPDGTVRYIDSDSTVYTDPQPPALPVPAVELEGPLTEKLSPEFIELVESTLKLNKALNFKRLQLNLTEDTVRMYLQDGTELDFGSAKRLKDKALRGAQILTMARQKYTGPFALDFRFFENGKVFLTQKAL